MASLTYGTKGQDVTRLQELLKGAGYQIDVDGIFGQQTQTAVKDYQTAHGLSVTGEVDDAMWGALTTPADTAAPVAPAAPVVPETSAPADSGSAALRDELISSIQRPTYTPLTPDEIRQQAAGAVGAHYDAQRLAAEQAAARTDLALEQQLAGLGAAYDKQREQSQAAYDRAVSDTDRAMLGRGMQRSSYAAQTLANLREEGADAQREISDQETQAAGNINSQRAQLAQQLAQQMASLNVSEAADVQSRVDELEAREYERQQAALGNSNALALQIYQLLMDKDAQAQSRDQWEREFAESIRQFNISAGLSGGSSGGGGGSYGSGGGSGSGGGGYGSDSGSAVPTGKDGAGVEDPLSAFLNGLSYDPAVNPAANEKKRLRPSARPLASSLYPGSGGGQFRQTGKKY